MSIKNPSYDEVISYSERCGFGLGALDRDEVVAVVQGMMDSYRRLDEIPNPYRPVDTARSLGAAPAEDENPLNAWAWRCSVKSETDGLLTGKTIALKDNISLAGIPSMNGSRVLQGFIPREDATVVTRILEAGGEIAGKAVCENFCFSGGSHTSYPKPVLNPVDESRMAGGSSSGSAALVKSGAVDMALGCDQGGSVRMPSSWSGIVGLKPSHGLVPYTGIYPIELTLDHCGPMTKSVRDAALLLQVIAGPDGLDPRQSGAQVGDYLAALDQTCSGLRVGVVAEGFDWEGASDPAVSEVVKNAAAALEGNGIEVKDISIPDHKDGIHIWNGIATEGGTAHMVFGNGSGYNWKGHYSLDMVDFSHSARLQHSRDMPTTVQFVAAIGKYMEDKYGGHYYAKSQNLGRKLTAVYDRALNDFDALIMPTHPMVAMPLQPDNPDSTTEYIQRALGMIQNTSPFNVTGHPAISVPCGTVNGLPVGMMIVGRRWSEGLILRIAGAVEALRL